MRHLAAFLLFLPLVACGTPANSSGTGGENAPAPTGDAPAATDASPSGDARDASSSSTEPDAPTPAMSEAASSTPTTELATLGAGCFWCVEAVYEQLDGVRSVTSGYMGGHVENPTYRAVCTGSTGHAEVVQVAFDPSVIAYDEILSWFWRLHDPTTLNRQGADVGTQYRSAIFTHSEEQAKVAAASKAAADASGHFSDPIVTEITPASTFYPAEDYHQEYYQLNKAQPYCRAVIAPKLGKLGLEK